MSEKLGVEESLSGNAIFVDLRIGKIAQTSNEHKPGFSPAQTRNKAGEIFKFYAKAYNSITGYIKDIRWHKFELETGGVIQGWNINIDTGDQEYILSLKDKDRPFHRVMSVLCAIDFSQPVRFNGFMGKNQTTKKSNKVLNLYQGGEKPVQPLYEEKWLSLELVEKLKAGLNLDELSERDNGNLAFNDDGTINKNYPYIKQNRDGKWSFDAWTNFLMEKIEEQVIPDVQTHQTLRAEAEAEMHGNRDYAEAFIDEQDDGELDEPEWNPTDEDVPEEVEIGW